MSKKILLLTAGHLSSCPRLLKEAEHLYLSGYSIEIFFLSSIPEIAKRDNEIIANHSKWKFHILNWNINSIVVTFSKIIFSFNKLLNFDSDLLQSTSFAFNQTLKDVQADLYIVHHPSLLPIAFKLAKRYNSKVVYDIEDAFPFVEDGRFESNPNKSIYELEKKYLNACAMITSASPFYIDLYKKMYKGIPNPIQLLNVFSAHHNEDIIYKDRMSKGKISLYWYSQTIGLNRGLQDIFLAFNILPINKFELHIRGAVNEEVKSSLLALITNQLQADAVYFHDLVGFEELENRNREHDIGLALETANNLNKELCISNKLLDYIRCGLMCIATDNKGHRFILDNFKNINCLYPNGDVSALTKILLNCLNNPNQIEQAKLLSNKLAMEKFSWEIESKNWSKSINEILN